MKTILIFAIIVTVLEFALFSVFCLKTGEVAFAAIGILLAVINSLIVFFISRWVGFR